MADVGQEQGSQEAGKQPIQHHHDSRFDRLPRRACRTFLESTRAIVLYLASWHLTCSRATLAKILLLLPPPMLLLVTVTTMVQLMLQQWMARRQQLRLRRQRREKCSSVAQPAPR